MKTRILYTKIYKDEFFADLTPSEKFLFIYYLTNEKVNIIHCYEITDREVTFDTGIDRDKIGVFKEKLQKSGRMLFFQSYVYLRNASKYENYTGEKNEHAKEDLVKQMSPLVLNWYNNLLNTPIDTPINTPLIGTINHKSEIINNKEGGVGETKYHSLTSLTTEVLQNVADEYCVTLQAVQNLKTDMELYCKSQGKTYKDYKATLQNWTRRKLDKGELANYVKPNKSIKDLIKERGVYVND